MVKLDEILKELNVIEFIGNDEVIVTNPVVLDTTNKNPSVIMWVNDSNIGKLKDLEYGTVLCSSVVEVSAASTVNIIKVQNPRNAFRIVLEKFFARKRPASISKSSVIDDSVKIGESAFIGENVVIEEGCVIGDNVEICHNTVVFAGTIIGNNVKIGANNTIGGLGFGYEKDQDGTNVLIPHLGNVILKDNVHTGNNVAIDRAVLGSTILQENVKLDNMVHVAHGVNIGENSLLTANVMIAGSTTIGKNVWIGPSAAIMNKITLDDNCYIGLGAVVLKSVNKNEIVVGNPAKPLQKK